MPIVIMLLSNALNGLVIYLVLNPILSLGLQMVHYEQNLPIDNPEARLYACIAAVGAVLLVNVINRFGALEPFLMLWQSARPASQRELARLAPLVDHCTKSLNYPAVKIFTSNNESINAFALGRKSIVFSSGALQELNDEELKAVAGHELAHLVHKDSYYNMCIAVMRVIPDMLYNLSMKIIATIINISSFVSRFGLFSIIAIPVLIIAVSFAVAIFVPTALIRYVDRRLLPLLERKASRDAEYRADLLGAKVSSTAAMKSALEKIQKQSDAPTQNFFQRLLSTHPDVAYRLDALDAAI